MHEELRNRLAQIRATGVDPAGQVFIERNVPAFTDDNHAAKDLLRKLTQSQNNAAALHVERNSLATEIGFLRTEKEALQQQLNRSTIDHEGTRVALSLTVSRCNAAAKMADEYEEESQAFNAANAEILALVDKMRATTIPVMRPWANRIEAVVLALADRNEDA